MVNILHLQNIILTIQFEVYTYNEASTGFYFFFYRALFYTCQPAQSSVYLSMLNVFQIQGILHAHQSFRIFMNILFIYIPVYLMLIL
jgi:hypothetical protein